MLRCKTPGLVTFTLASARFMSRSPTSVEPRIFQLANCTILWVCVVQSTSVGFTEDSAAAVLFVVRSSTTRKLADRRGKQCGRPCISLDHGACHSFEASQPPLPPHTHSLTHTHARTHARTHAHTHTSRKVDFSCPFFKHRMLLKCL